MKKLLLILLILPIIVSGNDWRNEWLKPDKAAHFVGSAAITCASIEIAKDCKLNKRDVEIIGLATALGVGMAKEFLYDSRPSPYDLGANIIGCVAGVYINRWLQKSKKKAIVK